MSPVVKEFFSLDEKIFLAGRTSLGHQKTACYVQTVFSAVAYFTGKPKYNDNAKKFRCFFTHELV